MPRIDFGGGGGGGSGGGVIIVPPSISDVPDQSLSNGTAFSYTPTVQNPSGFALTYSINGSLPTGLTIDSSTGVISGTPSGTGTFNGQIQITYPGGSVFGRLFTWTVSGQFSFNSIGNQATVIQEAFSFTPSVNNAGGFTPTYSISAGSLPTGLSINTSTGQISGTPTVAGTQSGIKIRANLGTGTVDSNSFSVQIEQAVSLGVISNQTAYQNDAFSFSPSITNPDSLALQFSVLQGTLPGGISILGSTGALTGTPGVGTPGSYLLKLRCSFGNSSHVDSSLFTITVKTAPTIATIADQTDGYGVAYSFTPSVTNPDAITITYSLATGSLPPGITLNSSTGVLSGTPTDQTTTSYGGISLKLAYGVAGQVISNTFGFTVTASSSRAALGVNLAEMVDYGSQFAFKNMIKQGRTWTPSSGSLTLDAQGYPASLTAGQSARMYWITAIPNSGTPYTETHDGIGTFNKIFQNSTQMFWDITATTAGNNVRNIKMFIPGTSDPDGTQPFYQPFLDMLSGVGVLRFMDWDSTNLNQIVNWTDRTTVDQYTYTGGTSPASNVHGQQNTVPYEHMIALCNAVSADMWVCIPAAASDNYITQLATLIFNTLNPALKCYFEISNEVWNGSFYGNSYFKSQAVAQGLGSSFANILQAYSRRCVQAYALIDAVYAGHTSRRVRVMSGQTGNTGTATTPLAFENAYQHVDYFAIAPYLLLSLPAGATQSDIQTHIYSATDGYSKNITDVNNIKTVATGTYGIPLAFYEFGPGFPNSAGDANTSAYLTYNISAAMEQAMKDYLQAVWVNTAGSCPACWYHVCAPASQFDWGLCRTVLDTNTSKMRAFQSFLHIAPQPPPATQPPIISTVADQTITQNQSWSFTPSVSNPSSLTQVFSMDPAQALPTGLSISSIDGTISGTPTVVATTSNLRIQDGYSGAASGTVKSNNFFIAVQSGGSGPVSGYRAWFDPSDNASVILNGSAFQQLTDKSANGLHLTQPTAGSQPQSTTINSLRATNHPWNGLSLTSSANLSSFISTTLYTVFMVVKPTIPTSNASDYNNNAAWGTNGATATGLYLSSGTPSMIALNDDGVLDQAIITFSSNTGYVVCTQHDGTNIKISLNGGAFTSVASGATADLAHQLSWGRGIGASPWYQGAIGEALFYDTALDSTNISTNITYLRNKWGV